MKKQEGIAPLLVIILIALGIGVYLAYQQKSDFSLQQNQTPQSVPKEASLDDFVSYTIPNGWNKEKLGSSENPLEVISLVSLDIEENPIPAITKGARIRISRTPHDTNKTLKEEIIASLPLPLREKPGEIMPIKINEIEGLNKFTCWEGCYDNYYVIKDNYKWDFRFECAPNCSTKTEADTSKYTKDRDLFINSVKFLD